MNTFFQEIFYPSNSDFGELGKARRNLELPLVAIAPHGAWDYTLDLLKTLFGELQSLDPKSIVVLSSPHQKSLVDGVLCTSDHTMEGYDWKLDLSSLKGCTVYDPAFSEEAAFEVLMPFIAKVFPSSKVYCLLSSGPASEQKKALESIRRIDDKALIIISTNLNRQSSEELEKKERANLIEVLTHGYRKLDPKAVSPCGLSWLNEFGGTYEVLQMDEERVGHAVAIRIKQ